MATEINNIVCEKCNTMYRYDASRIPPQGRKVRCSTCGHIFVAMPRTAPSPRSTLATEADPGEQSSREAAREEEEESELQLDDEESPKRREQVEAQKKNRILLRQDSTRYAVADIATLQRWIVERRVSREAELSMDGEVWERIADRTELAPFFNIVERNKTRKMTVRRDATGEFQTGSLPTAERTEGGTRSGRTRSGVRGDTVRATQAGTSANASGAISVGTLESGASDAQKAGADAARAPASGPSATGAASASPGTAASTAASPAAASASAGAKPAGADSKAPASAQAPATGLRPPVPATTSASPAAERAQADGAVVVARPDAMAAGVKALYTVGALILLAALAYSVLRTPTTGPASGPGGVALSSGSAGNVEASGTATSGTAGVVPSAGMVGNGVIGSSPAAGQGSAVVPGSTAATGTGTAGVKGAVPGAMDPKPGAVTPKPAESVAPVSGGDASKPVDPKAVEPKPADVKPTEPKSTELKPTELKPGESKPPVNAGTAVPPAGPPAAPAALTPEEKIAMARPIGKAEDYLKAGSSYLKREQYAQAVESLRKAAELNGSSAVIQKELGWALHHNSQVDYRNSNALKDESVRAFQKAISLNRKYADAYYGLGVVYFELGSRNEAYRNLKAALDNGLKGKDDITEVKSFLTQLEAQGAGGQ